MQTNNPAAISAAPATTELSAILHDFCEVRNRLDSFYESEHGEIMREYADNYHSADNALGEAFGTLFDFVGYYLHTDFATHKNGEQ